MIDGARFSITLGFCIKGHFILKNIPFLWLVLCLTACTSAPSLDNPSDWLAPSDALRAAASNSQSGVTGDFAMLVQATGSRDGFTYLNSELDYRDPRCLTIAIPKAVALKLQAQLGEDPLQALKGKHVVVNGTAKRVTVLFLKDGKPTGKYYYQTHVTVTNPKQITVVPKR